MGGVRLLGSLGTVAERAEIDWDDVYRQELPRVYNFFRYRFGNRTTAEDLTSVTFEKAWKARHRYRRERAAVSTWLLAIARNVAVDHLRRTRPEIPLDEAEAEAGARHETPETAALRAGQHRRLWSLLAALPAREQELLSLKYGADATNRAIASLTGLSESNVGTILHRTVSALRASWHEGEAR
jgi:RNA polymerase sigma-70 factor, ECF subfamily